MIAEFLELVIKDDTLHARWLNTLSYLEYLGARKIIKSQHEEDIDELLLEHMAEEIHHAYFLKKIMRRSFSRLATTFADQHLLAKTAAKKYLKSIDTRCASMDYDTHHTYVLTSYIIETRALLLYTTYDELLQEKKMFRLSSILKQEQRHLLEMRAKLYKKDQAFFSIEHELLEFEELCFKEFLSSLYQDINYHDKAPN